jgi:cardiolipin synthase A/B
VLDSLLWLTLMCWSVVTASHALLTKRDSRAALIWILLCFTLPGVGALLYWVLGVNRIRTRAKDLKDLKIALIDRPWPEPHVCYWSPRLALDPIFLHENYHSLHALADGVTRRPLVSGNVVVPMFNGEQAYPAMLEAIAGAREMILLSTYIFGSGKTGKQYVAALEAAAERGVKVKVLIDALGERYSFPPARRYFKHPKVQVVRFLPLSPFGRGMNFNLRNHRKLLVVDGRIGFTGGMNLADRHLAADVKNPTRTSDVHFRIVGPVVAQLQEAFSEDWSFSAREKIPKPEYPPVAKGGEAYCRGISAGPNEDYDKLMWILIGACNSARHHLRIMTPYFVPERPLIAAINSAALRGVDVEILLPIKNNLPFVAWATRAYLWEMLQHGTKIYYQPAPFAHSKLLLVDHHYALVGSANLDPRSLRLNFEFNLEVYDRGLNHKLVEHFDQTRQLSKLITLNEIDSRPLALKLLDSFVKLFSPYL